MSSPDSRSVEQAFSIVFALPKNQTGVAYDPSTDDFMFMGDYNRCAIRVITGALAAGDAVLTAEQAINQDGGSSKALAFTKYWTRAVGDLWVAQETAAATITLDTASTEYIIEFRRDELDVNNGTFAFLAAKITAAGGNDYYCGFYDFYDADLKTSADKMFTPYTVSMNTVRA